MPNTRSFGVNRVFMTIMDKRAAIDDFVTTVLMVDGMEARD